MTDTPMTPDREQWVRSLLEGYTAARPLLAELDRLRARVTELEGAVERAQSLAARLDEFAENALRVDDRELYTAIASDLRARLGGTSQGES